MKIQKQNGLLRVSLLLSAFVVLLACQKKEVIQAEDPVPVDTTKVITCPGCTFPDSVWQTGSGTSPKLIFRFVADSLQERLNSQGQLSVPSPDYGSQSPVINGCIINWIELMPQSTTAPGKGVLLYRSETSTCGGSEASNYCKTVMVKNNEVFFSVSLSSIPAGSYKWLRISILYTDFSIKVRNTSSGQSLANFGGFSGDNTYLTQLRLNHSILTPTLSGIGNKKQGYWIYFGHVFEQEQKFDGQLSQITVVNPNPDIQNIPGNSWTYGEFFSQASSVKKALEITGQETQSLEVKVSLSTNKCFEWKELTYDGLFQPEIGETLVDFGTRGMVPRY